jgi:hypothetical protein
VFTSLGYFTNFSPVLKAQKKDILAQLPLNHFLAIFDKTIIKIIQTKYYSIVDLPLLGPKYYKLRKLRFKSLSFH